MIWLVAKKVPIRGEVYWNEDSSQWLTHRALATKFTRYDYAEAVAEQEGGYIVDQKFDLCAGL